ncbi:unnamed protein product, partial [Effrenium voratum]
MRIPSSGEAFQVRSLTSDPRLPLQGEWTSVRALSWSLLWHTLNFCLSHELSETFVETLTSSLGALRSSQTCSPVENLILLQFSLVLATAPSWYLASAPWQADDTALGGEPSSVGGLLKEALAEVPAQSDERVHEFIEASPAVLWDLSRRTEGEPLVYSKAPAPVANLVTPNASKSELWSTAALRERPSEELMQSFLSAHTPTHRTMLNISSARLQHVQGIAFGFLEETQSLGVAVEAVLLCQLCAVFLDGHRMVDSNKLALAARTLCVIILVCRRSLLEQMLRIGDPELQPSALRHIEKFLNSIIPMLCQALTALICCKGPPKRAGVWKLALEALFYIVEDSLPALAHCAVADSYWCAVTTSLSKVLQEMLAPGSDDSLLSQVFGNLLTQRILPCPQTPAAAAEKIVHLLQVLVSQPGMGSLSLRHFFALCASEVQVDEMPEGKLSVMSATAAGATPAAVPIPCRSALLGVAAPALLGHVRSLFAHYLQEEEARQRGLPANPGMKAPEVRLALAQLQRLQVDEEVVAAAAPAASDR